MDTPFSYSVGWASFFNPAYNSTINHPKTQSLDPNPEPTVDNPGEIAQLPDLS
jgi:hypothetical protein